MTSARTGLLPRMPRGRRAVASLPALATALVLAGCGAQTPPPKVENIVLPANVEAEPPPPPAPPAEPVPPELVNASKGEDLWHLRSALNVAALICDNKAYTSLIPNYNRLLKVHKALLTAAVQSELDQFKVVDKKKWQALYDTHMTKLYNQYSLTQQRGKFCDKASDVAGRAGDMTAEALSMEATAMIFRLNVAGEINQSLLASGVTPIIRPANAMVQAAPATAVVQPLPAPKAKPQ
jgi:hypothetical protein